MDACFIRFEKALALELGDGIGVDGFKRHAEPPLEARPVDAARRACLREAVQFLDETVVGRGVRFARNEQGHAVLRRAFEFEYSPSGDDRYPGAVVLEGRDVVLVDVSAHRLARRATVIDLR